MMKMVSIINGEIQSYTIQENMIYELLEEQDNTRVPTKSPYELIRLKNYQTNELIIIYQENKRMRSRNDWLEKRALYKLVENLPHLAPIKRNVKFIMNGVETEVDGVSNNVMIEIKGKTVDDNLLKFLEDKQTKLGFKKLIVIAKRIKVQNHQPMTTLFTFKPDHKTLNDYYLNEIKFPKFVRQHIGKRHIRFLKNNGNWTSQNHRYTKTAKWDIIDKFRRDYTKISRNSQPVKIYWSLSAMTGPLDEFRGKGYPIELYLAAFDVDGSHEGPCEINRSPICEMCSEDAEIKLSRVTSKLNKLGHEFKVFSSGSKGYHIYLFDEYEVVIFNQEQMEEIINLLIPDIDPFLSKNTGEFDSHRIFKVPHTVDASTGKIVSEGDKILQFQDELQPVKIDTIRS